MRIFFILMGMLSVHGLCAQTDTVYVKDFGNDWLFTDEGVNFPLVRKSEFRGNVIHFPITQAEIGDGYLEFQYSGAFSVLLDGTMIVSAVDNYVMAYSGKESSFVTVYAKNLNPYALSTRAFKTVPSDLAELQDEVVIVNPRIRTVFNDFYMIASLVLLVAFTLLAIYNAKPLAEYYRVVRAISPRELDENLLKSRPFTGVNLSIYFFFSMLASCLIISVVHKATLFRGQFLFYPDTLAGAMFNWLIVAMVIFGSIYVRYFFLSLFSRLFQVQQFVNSHFFNSIRLALMEITLLSICFAFFYFVISPQGLSPYISMYQILLIALVPISIIIYIKLIAASSFKNLHLFSYLCGTELIPYILILSLGIN